jgi:hypothetical protein
MSIKILIFWHYPQPHFLINKNVPEINSVPIPRYKSRANTRHINQHNINHHQKLRQTLWNSTWACCWHHLFHGLLCIYSETNLNNDACYQEKHISRKTTSSACISWCEEATMVNREKLLSAAIPWEVTYHNCRCWHHCFYRGSAEWLALAVSVWPEYLSQGVLSLASVGKENTEMLNELLWWLHSPKLTAYIRPFQ